MNRIYRIAVNKVDGKNYPLRNEVKETFNKAISQIDRSFHEYNWNVAISRIMDLVSEINKDEKVDITIWKEFVKLFAPFAPFITEELWEMTGEKQSVHLQEYPEIRTDIVEKTMRKVIITINGKKRGELDVINVDEKAIISKSLEVVSRYGVNSDTKYTYVKGRVVNFTT